MDNFPAQLSGGEQQRVSIARALAKNPKIILCDEPTGALDYHTGKAVLKLLQDTCRSTGKTVLIITHNSALTRIADRVIRVKNGTVIESGVNDAPLPVERIEKKKHPARDSAEPEPVSVHPVHRGAGRGLSGGAFGHVAGHVRKRRPLHGRISLVRY